MTNTLIYNNSLFPWPMWWFKKWLCLTKCWCLYFAIAHQMRQFPIQYNSKKCLHNWKGPTYYGHISWRPTILLELLVQFKLCCSIVYLLLVVGWTSPGQRGVGSDDSEQNTVHPSVLSTYVTYIRFDLLSHHCLGANVYRLVAHLLTQYLWL